MRIFWWGSLRVYLQTFQDYTYKIAVLHGRLKNNNASNFFSSNPGDWGFGSENRVTIIETNSLGNLADFYLPKDNLFEEKVREYAYEPFGSLAFTLNAGEDGTNPRYTDHERDRFTRLNYMKGRWQLGALTSPASPSSTAPTPKETGTGKTQPPKTYTNTPATTQ